MDEGREAMAHYCKAQAQLLKLEKNSDLERKTLYERVRTSRSVLQDELLARNVTCLEIPPLDGDADPLYARIKPTMKSDPINTDMVLDIFRNLDSHTLREAAEKNGHDVPRMLCSILSAHIKTRNTENNNKTTLSISKTKERGFTKAQQTNIPQNVTDMAIELIQARSELSCLQKKNNESKKPILEQQKDVEESVKNSLKKIDPVKMTTRVHMMQEGDEWVYYLRCREKEITPTLGVRRIIPMVENAVVKTLDKMGFGREFSTTFSMNNAFLLEFERIFSESYNMALQDTKISSRLSLDRAAPRRAKS